MKTFDALVAARSAVDVDDWGFDWLTKQASEEYPPWAYVRLLAQRLPTQKVREIGYLLPYQWTPTRLTQVS